MAVPYSVLFNFSNSYEIIVLSLVTRLVRYAERRIIFLHQLIAIEMVFLYKSKKTVSQK